MHIFFLAIGETVSTVTLAPFLKFLLKRSLQGFSLNIYFVIALETADHTFR